MVENLVILPVAERDIEESHAWYEGRDPGLGEEYLRCVDTCLLSIRRTPEAFQIVRKDYRRALIRRFPYGIYDKLVQDSVVYAVLHGSHDPDTLRKRRPRPRSS